MAIQEFDLWEGLIYKTPNIPPLKSIRNFELKKKDQVFTRHTEYEQWEWNEDPKQGPVWWDEPEEGQLEWFRDEIYRILNGEWQIIEGKAVWLNNFSYFYHQWFITKEGYHPEFRDTSQEFLRFLEIVFKDPKCRGGNTMKGRRKGISTMCMSVMLQFGLIKENTEQGITSKSNTDAEKIFQLMLVNGYARLPSFLKPRISGNDLPKQKIHFTKKAGSITKEKQTGGDKEGLNNKIEFRAPGANVFDGDGLWLLLLDEAGKWLDVKIDDYLVTASQIIHAGKQTGRIIIITTVNAGDKGGDNYKIVWKGSNQLRLDELGQTENKLYRQFIPGYMGGRDGGWIDAYGNSVWDTPTPEQFEYLKTDPNTIAPHMGCKQYCELQRKKLANDPEKLQEEIRMFPFTPQEAFNSANNQCNFNVADLNEQTERIETLLEGTGKKENGRRMTFKMASNGTKYPVDDPKGYWYILELIENDNKSLYKGSIKCPDNIAFAAAGMDTYANARATVEKGSDACIVISTRYDALKPDTSGSQAAMLLGRPDTKGEFHTQVSYGLEYYGIKMLAERSPTDWEDYFIEKCLASPLSSSKKHGYLITTKRSDESDVYGIAPQDKQAREQHLTEMKEYALNNMHKIKFLRILKDMKDFNIENRTDFDGCMAWGYSLIGLRETVKQSTPIKSIGLSILPGMRKVS